MPKSVWIVILTTESGRIRCPERNVKTYPVNLYIEGRNCLVVGGGAVGTRKTLGLLRCRARVTVVSPRISGRLQEMAGGGNPRLRQRSYRVEDLEGMFLVMGATDDEALNERIHLEAEARGMLCNIADRPAVCNFILPAVVRRGDLVLAVSTSGRSPAFARRLRIELENQFGPEYGELLELMGAVRLELLANDHAPEAHKPLFEALLDGGLLEMLQAKRRRQIDALLMDVLGPGFTLDRLTNDSTAADQTKRKPPCRP